VQRNLLKGEIRTRDRPHTVFISYSTRDNAVAQTITGILETRGVPCWIAPRDVPHGSLFAKAIAEAIERCNLFLLVFSPASDQSEDVLSELTLAKTTHKVLLPVRICDCRPSNRTAYFLAGVQSFDAFGGSLTDYAESLTQAVQRLISARPTPDNGRSSEDPPPPRWLPIILAAVVTTLLLQALFYATGVVLLRGWSLLFVFFVSGGFAWAVRGIWSVVKQRKERPS